MLRRPPRAVAAVAALLGVVVFVGAWSSARAEADELGRITSELEDAREERAEVQERIDAATRAYEELVARIAELEADEEELSADVDRLQAELEQLDGVVAERLRAVFKHGSNIDPLTVFLASDDPQVALSRAETVQRAVATDRGRTEELSAAQDRLDAARERLAQRGQELDEARDAQAEVREELQAGFEELGSRVGDLERERREEEARIERERREQERQARLEREREREAAAQQRSSEPAAGSTSSSNAPRSSSGMACPLDQPRSFIDSWGYARSGGRAHRGTDIMGPLGIPVRAITDGVWDIQSPGRSAGLWAILRTSSGDQFWYLHLDSHTVADGARVSAGQQVGTNGSTGNAVAGAEHIHFEYHPGGGGAINPYSLLRRVCG